MVRPAISNPFPTPEYYTRARSMVDAARWTAPVMWIQPNPNRGRFRIAFEVRAEGPVAIDLYDASGRRIARIFDGFLAPGLKPST